MASGLRGRLKEATQSLRRVTSSRYFRLACFQFELTRTLCAQIELLQFLKEKFHEKNRVSVERVVSGPGLVSVYEFLKQHRDWKGKIDPKIDAEFQGVEYASYEPLALIDFVLGGSAAARDLNASVIAQNSTTDALCRKAMEIFMRYRLRMSSPWACVDGTSWFLQGCKCYDFPAVPFLTNSTHKLTFQRIWF